MRWQGRRESENVEDRRSLSGGTLMAGGGIGTIIIILIALYLGIDPQPLIQQLPQGGAGQQQAAPLDPRQQQTVDFVKVVLADTEDVWNEQFRKFGVAYKEPKLILFRDSVQSACGMANSAVGPFYCPGDQNVYIDLTFFDELNRRFGAPGDFAQAYVLAHEVGHHVQNLLGYTDKMNALRGRISDRDMNKLSVEVELQADFLAGVWAHHTQEQKQVLEDGDIKEAISAASAVGDDSIQKKSQGYVVPDSFTHGSAEQRAKAFLFGFKTGDIKAWDEVKKQL
ncbi:MAG: neutral zinc metallopeptidase [Planctomycetota bacterium]|nr:neutral zinc metallopeptidase [Planctomycetota bacterium]